MKKYNINTDFANFLKFASSEIDLPSKIVYYLENKTYKRNERFYSYDEDVVYLKSIIVREEPEFFIGAKIGNAKSSSIIAKKILEEINGKSELTKEDKEYLKVDGGYFNVSANIQQKLRGYNSKDDNLYTLSEGILLTDAEFEDLKKLAIKRLKEKSSFKEEKALPYLSAIDNKDTYGILNYFKNKELLDSLYIGPIFINNLYFDANKSDYFDYEFASNFVKKMDKVNSGVESNESNEEKEKINYVVYETLSAIEQGMSVYSEDSNWAKIAFKAFNAILKSYQFKKVIESNVNNNQWRKLLESIKDKGWNLPPDVEEFMKVNLILESIPDFFINKKVENANYSETLNIDQNNFYKNFPDVYKMNNKESIRDFCKHFQDVLALSSNVEMTDILVGNSMTMLPLASSEPIDIKYIKFLFENFVDFANNYENLSVFLKEPNQEVIMTDLALRLQQKYLEEENKVEISKKQSVLKF